MAKPPASPAKGPAKTTGGSSLFADARDLVLCTLGIYTCYLGYGIFQESVYKQEFDGGEKFKFSLFLVFCQCVINGAVAFVTCLIQKPDANKVPHSEYMKIALSYLGAMFASNFALGYISYPTQSLGKSCKMIPVMLSRIVINNKRYKLREYLTVLLITAGISFFMLSAPSKKVGAATSLFGLFLLFVSLGLDGFTGPTQESIIQRYGPSSDQLMLWINVYAVGMSVTILIITGELFEAVGFLAKHPAIFRDMFVCLVLFAAGQKVIMLTLFRFDSLVLTMITTTRKFFTILASVVVHGHVLNLNQWLAVGMVFVGVGLDIYFKASARKAVDKKSKSDA